MTHLRNETYRMTHLRKETRIAWPMHGKRLRNGLSVERDLLYGSFAETNLEYLAHFREETTEWCIRRKRPTEGLICYNYRRYKGFEGHSEWLICYNCRK